MFSEKQGIWRVESKDFNEDGYKDMLVGYDGNSVVYDLGLFDTISDTFKLVEGFDNFWDAFILKGTNYYYSYSSAGCADLNWNSKLFYIKNYKAHIVGSIKGVGCEHEKKNGIFISKIDNGKENLVKYISREPGYYADKWDFIQKY